LQFVKCFLLEIARARDEITEFIGTHILSTQQQKGTRTISKTLQYIRTALSEKQHIKNNKKNIQNVCSIYLVEMIPFNFKHRIEILKRKFQHQYKAKYLSRSVFPLRLYCQELDRVTAWRDQIDASGISPASLFHRDQNRNYYRFSFFTPADTPDYTGRLMAGRWRSFD